MPVPIIQGVDPHCLTPSPEILARSSKTTTIFNRSTQFFVDLLKWGGNSSLNGAMYITLFAMDLCTAVQTIFYRLIFSPPFNPLNPAFKEVTLKNYENRVPKLMEKMILIGIKFESLTSFDQDLKDLEQISNEIQDIYSKLQHYHSILKSRHNFKALEEDVKRVLDQYEVLDLQMLAFFDNNSPKILKLFKQQLVLLIRKGLDLPSNWQDEMNSRWSRLIATHENYISRLPDVIKAKFNKLLRMMKRVIEGEKHPLRLRNYANSCYLASTLQAFACLDSFRSEVKKPIPFDPSNPSDFAGKAAIQNELLKFIDVQKSAEKRSPLNLQFFLSLLDSNHIENLRTKIFESKLHPSLDDLAQRHHQQDAVDIAGLFIDHFFAKNKFAIEYTKTSSEFPGIAFQNREDENILRVSLSELDGIENSGIEDESDEERKVRIYQEKMDKSQMVDLIHQAMEVNIDDPKNTILFDPQNHKFILTDPIEGEKSKTKKAAQVANYHRSVKIINPPEVLTLQFFGFKDDNKGSFKKIDRPVVLPPDGVIDLTPYASESAKYQIASYVVHHGGYKSGHYTSYVSIDGKYYYCDDLKPEYYEEIEKEQFFSCTTAYLVTLKKI